MKRTALLVVLLALPGCLTECGAIGHGVVGRGAVSDGAVGGGAVGGRPSGGAVLVADFPVQPDVWLDATKEIEAGTSAGALATATDFGLLGIDAAAITDSPVLDDACGPAEWNGGACFDFDGTNDQYATATQTANAAPYLTAVMVSRDTTATMIASDTKQQWGRHPEISVTQSRSLFGSSYVSVIDPRPTEANRVRLYCAHVNGASTMTFMSGRYVAGQSVGTPSTWNGSVIGGTYTQSSDLDGKIGFYVYKDDFINEELDCWDVAAYAQWRYGVLPRVDRQPATEVWDTTAASVQHLTGGDYVCDRRTGGTILCPNTGSCRVMTLGDSTTAWSGTQYQNVVERDLGWGCAATDQQGASGQNISWLKTNRWDVYADNSYDALVLMTGTNDIRFGTSADDVMTQVDGILSDAAALGIKTLLMSPPPCTGATSCDASDDAGFDDLRTQMSAAADGSTVLYFDMYEALGDSGNARALASWCDDGDSLHPDSSCHEWVMAPIVKGYIQGAAFTSYGIVFEDAGTKTQVLSTSDAVVDLDTAAANKGWTVAGDGTITTSSGGTCYVEADLFVSFASGTPTLTFTIYKEGVATALTDTVVIAGTSTYRASLGGSVSCSADDTFDVRVKADSGTPTMTVVKGAVWGRR